MLPIKEIKNTVEMTDEYKMKLTDCFVENMDVFTAQGELSKMMKEKQVFGLRNHIKKSYEKKQEIFGTLTSLVSSVDSLEDLKTESYKLFKTCSKVVFDYNVDKIVEKVSGDFTKFKKDFLPNNEI